MGLNVACDKSGIQSFSLEIIQIDFVRTLAYNKFDYLCPAESGCNMKNEVDYGLLID